MVYIYGVIYNREPIKPSYWGTLFAPPSSASPSVFTRDEDDGGGLMPRLMLASEICCQETDRHRVIVCVCGVSSLWMTGLCLKSLQIQKKKTQPCLR